MFSHKQKEEESANKAHVHRKNNANNRKSSESSSGGSGSMHEDRNHRYRTRSGTRGCSEDRKYESPMKGGKTSGGQSGGSQEANTPGGRGGRDCTQKRRRRGNSGGEDCTQRRRKRGVKPGGDDSSSSKARVTPEDVDSEDEKDPGMSHHNVTICLLYFMNYIEK